VWPVEVVVSRQKVINVSHVKEVENMKLYGKTLFRDNQRKFLKILKEKKVISTSEIKKILGNKKRLNNRWYDSIKKLTEIGLVEILHYETTEAYYRLTQHGELWIELYGYREEFRESIIYLASPYTHASESVMKERFDIATECAKKIFKAGFNVFSPITHGHPFTTGKPEWKGMEAVNMGFLSICDRFVIIKLDGWTKSKGVGAERLIAKIAGIKEEYIENPEKFVL